MAFKRLAANFTRNATSFADVDNGSGDALSFAVTNGKRYRFRVVYIWSTAATTTGLDIACNGPTKSYVTGLRWIQTAVTAYGTRCAFNDYDQSAPGIAADSIDAACIAVLEGVIKPTADGTFMARVASEISLSTITVLAGSYIEYECLDDLVTAGQCVMTTTDVSNSTLTPADVDPASGPSLAFSLAANKWYRFRFNVLWWSAASTTSLSLGVNGSSSPTAVWARNIIGNQLTGTAITEGSLRAYNVMTTGANRPSTGAISYAVIEGTVCNGASAHDMIARFASEIDTSSVTILADSSVEFYEISAPPIKDCPNEGGYYYPVDADDYTALDATLPTHWYLMQGANVAAAGDDQQTAATDFDLTENGTLEYDQAFGAMSRKCVHFTQNLNERLIFGDFIDESTNSLVIKISMILGDQSTTRAIGIFGASPELWIRCASTEVIGITVNGVTSNGNFSYLGVGPFVLALILDHRSPGAVRVVTKHQYVAGTYAAPGRFSGKCLGSNDAVVANLAALMDVAHVEVYAGSPAEVHIDEGAVNRRVVTGV